MLLLRGPSSPFRIPSFGMGMLPSFTENFVFLMFKSLNKNEREVSSMCCLCSPSQITDMLVLYIRGILMKTMMMRLTLEFFSVLCFFQ